MKTRAQFLTSLLMIFSIAQCGGQKSLSSKVEFKSRSEEPIVINGDITIGIGDDKVTVKHPWFLWNYSVKNDSKYRVVIPTATFHVSTRKSGIKLTKDVVIDPGQFCSSSGSRPYLAIVEPQDLFGTLDEFSGTTFGSCDIGDTSTRLTPPQYENWYIADLGESDTGIYSVEVEAVGWFEDISTGEIVERFDASDFVTTR
jgi:hypothetical protein